MSRSDPNLLAITVPAHPDQLPWMRETLDLTILLDPDTVSFSVIDHGSWEHSTPERSNTRGHGLDMIGALAGQADLNPTSHGTALTAHFPRHD
jgi:hypothetical protein